MAHVILACAVSSLEPVLSCEKGRYTGLDGIEAAGFPETVASPDATCRLFGVSTAVCGETVAAGARCRLDRDMSVLDVFSSAVVDGGDFNVDLLRTHGSGITIRKVRFRKYIEKDSGPGMQFEDVCGDSPLVYTGTQPRSPVDLSGSAFRRVGPCDEVNPGLYAGIVALGSFVGTVTIEDATVVTAGGWGEIEQGTVKKVGLNAVVVDIASLTKIFGNYETQYILGDGALNTELATEALIVGGIAACSVASLFIAHGRELYYVIKSTKKRTAQDRAF